MHGSAPWKTEETIVGLPRLLVLSVFSRFGGCHLSTFTFPPSGWLSPFHFRTFDLRAVDLRRSGGEAVEVPCHPSAGCRALLSDSVKGLDFCWCCIYNLRGRGKMPEPPDEIIAAECLAVRLRALNRAVTALYDDALRPHGLRVGQLNLLVAVARMGAARPGDLCCVLHMDKSTLSRDVQVMCRNGWLTVPGH